MSPRGGLPQLTALALSVAVLRTEAFANGAAPVIPAAREPAAQGPTPRPVAEQPPQEQKPPKCGSPESLAAVKQSMSSGGTPSSACSGDEGSPPTHDVAALEQDENKVLRLGVRSHPESEVPQAVQAYQQQEADLLRRIQSSSHPTARLERLRAGLLRGYGIPMDGDTPRLGAREESQILSAWDGRRRGFQQTQEAAEAQRMLVAGGFMPSRFRSNGRVKNAVDQKHGELTTRAIRYAQQHFNQRHSADPFGPRLREDGVWDEQTRQIMAAHLATGRPDRALPPRTRPDRTPPGRTPPGRTPPDDREPPQQEPGVTPPRAQGPHDESPESVSTWKRVTGIAANGIVESTLRWSNALGFQYPEMAFGIIRQESTNATDNRTSTAGARGPYQIMPNTAMHLARWLRTNYGMDISFNPRDQRDLQRLRTDWDFNTMMAIAHLKRTEQMFRIRELNLRTASRFALSYHTGDGARQPNGPVGRRYISVVPPRVLSLRAQMMYLANRRQPDA
ncbi:MAG: hypothetical protein HY078_05300 [Elusimicrobia bacterium]|nr:hypothetical protein [Elusimicrobiota bacterium]